LFLKTSYLSNWKDGQNVRLAAKLTGWKIDVRMEGDETPIVEEETQSSPEATAGEEEIKN